MSGRDESFGRDETSRAGAALQRGANAFTVTRELLVERPLMLVPFALVGVLARVVEAIRLSDPVPVQIRRFPDFGYRLPTLMFPMGFTTHGIPVGAVIDLQPRFLVTVVALNATVVVAAALANAVLVAWLFSTDFIEGSVVVSDTSEAADSLRGATGRLAPRRLLRLVAYALVVTLFGSTVAVANTMAYSIGVVWTLVAFTVAAHLILVPSVLVAQPITLLDAVRHSVAFCRSRWLGFVVFLAFLGFGSYLAASIPVVGTTVSVALAGTTYTVGSASAYSDWLDSDVRRDKSF